MLVALDALLSIRIDKDAAQFHFASVPGAARRLCSWQWQRDRDRSWHRRPCRPARPGAECCTIATYRFPSSHHQHRLLTR